MLTCLQEGRWIWIRTGEEMNYTNWRVDGNGYIPEPNGGRGENFLAMNPGTINERKWKDYASLTTFIGPLCQYF